MKNTLYTESLPARRSVLSSKSLFILLVSCLLAWAIALVWFIPDAGQLFREHWIIIVISFIAAAFANATAIGGGFLFLPLFIFVYQLPAIAALKLSISTQAFGMSSGALGWSREYIVSKALLVSVLGSLPGVYMATYTWELPNQMIKQTFAWVSIAIFIIIMIELYYGKHAGFIRLSAGKLKLAGLVIVSYIGGLVTGWTAIGIGELVALYLLLVYRINMQAAIGTGVAVLAVDSIAGFIFHIRLGGIPWEYLMFTIPGVLIGGFAGARIARYIEHRTFRLSHHKYAAGAVPVSPLKILVAVIILINSLVILIGTN